MCVQIKVRQDLKFQRVEIKIGFPSGEIEIATSAGRILNLASIDRNFDFYRRKPSWIILQVSSNF